MRIEALEKNELTILAGSTRPLITINLNSEEKCIISGFKMVYSSDNLKELNNNKLVFYFLLIYFRNN